MAGVGPPSAFCRKLSLDTGCDHADEPPVYAHSNNLCVFGDVRQQRIDVQLCQGAPPHSHRLYKAVQPQSGACWLRHGPGVGWPDRHGLALLQAALAEPGAAVVLEFATLLDARQCLARLTSPAFDYWCRTCC